MSDKKKVIAIGILVVVLLGVITGIIVYRRNQNKKDYMSKVKYRVNNEEELTDVQKKIIGIENKDNGKEKEENYSYLYKEYLNLPKEERENLEVIPRKEEVPFEKLKEIKEEIKEPKKEITPKEDEKEIPEKFNLKDKIQIKVENQGMYGLCWDFASMKTLETYLAINNLGNYDFSELHLDYIESDLMCGNREVHNGGSFNNFQKYLIESGVVLEKDIPYSYKQYNESEYLKFIEMPKVIEVTETIDFPSIYKGENYINVTDEELEEFRETVKKHIMKNGGLYTSIVGTSEKNHYTAPSSPEWTDHAVTIVGWDDNYSKDNFLSIDGKKPEKDGAYIALNSWGEGRNDGGYYYISYEDKYVESNLSGIGSTSIEKAYKISSIKNESLKKFLIDNYEHQFTKYNGEDYITKNALSNITSLDLSDSNITSVEGIEMFSNIYTLYLSNNSIKDISPIASLKNLSCLDLSNNDLTDIDSFKNFNMSFIYSINLSGNKIKDVSSLINSKIDYPNLSLDLSRNPGVSGYEKLVNVNSLLLNDCEIEDVSNLKDLDNLMVLELSNNPNVSGLEDLPQSIYDLKLSNCNIEDLSSLVNKEGLSYLDISNNNITSLKGLKKLSNIFSIDVSGNKITDWSELKSIKERPQEDYYELYTLCANNCDIEDISIFNDLHVGSFLELKNNNIKDLSNFNNDKVYGIDLSGNKDITGLEALKNVYTVYLDECNISDINEVLKLEEVMNLSLENNNLTDVSDISYLKQLDCLSLAGNRDIKGSISSNRISSLNVSDCNLNNDLVFEKINSLYYLNISKNNIKSIINILNNNKYDYLSIIADELDFDEIEKIKTDDKKHFFINDVVLDLDYDLEEGLTNIDLSRYPLLRKDLLKSKGREKLNIENGKLNKNGYSIDVIDLNKNSSSIKFNQYGVTFSGTTIKINFNKIEEEDTNTASVNNIEEVIKEETPTPPTDTIITNTTEEKDITKEEIKTKPEIQNVTNTSIVNEITEDTNTVIEETTNTVVEEEKENTTENKTQENINNTVSMSL